MMVTVIAAVLAIVLTVALATRLRDLARTPAPTGVAGAPMTVHASSAGHGWNVSPLTPLLSAPAAVPRVRRRP